MNVNPPNTVAMALSKTTPGTYVYAEPTDKPRGEKTFPTIYVQKHALPDPPPETLRVTLDWD